MNPLTAADMSMHPTALLHVRFVIQSHVNSSSLHGQPNSSDASIHSGIPLHLTKNDVNVNFQTLIVLISKRS